jgi:hypothetical protein
MSIQFSDTDLLNGLVQIFEEEAGMNPGDISGSVTKLKRFAARANRAFDKYLRIAIPASGEWQYDDNNHTDYPIAKIDLVQGQRDYALLNDGSGNKILDIHKVFVKESATGVYKEIYPVDVQSSQGFETDSFTNGLDVQGVPFRYDKTANGIFLDQVPSYDATEGIMFYISREPSYFSYDDTTKKAGVPTCQEYMAFEPAFAYARRNKLSNLKEIQAEVLRLEAAIRSHFSTRERDTTTIIRPTKVNPR